MSTYKGKVTLFTFFVTMIPFIQKNVYHPFVGLIFQMPVFVFEKDIRDSTIFRNVTN